MEIFAYKTNSSFIIRTADRYKTCCIAFLLCLSCVIRCLQAKIYAYKLPCLSKYCLASVIYQNCTFFLHGQNLGQIFLDVDKQHDGTQANRNSTSYEREHLFD